MDYKDRPDNVHIGFKYARPPTSKSRLDLKWSKNIQNNRIGDRIDDNEYPKFARPKNKYPISEANFKWGNTEVNSEKQERWIPGRQTRTKMILPDNEYMY